jgi:hypothetical protein
MRVNLLAICRQSYPLTFRNSLNDETNVIEHIILARVLNDMSRKNNSTAVVGKEIERGSHSIFGSHHNKPTKKIRSRWPVFASL